MTKCNKILLCAMLAVVMTLACALTVLPAPPMASAEETETLTFSYTTTTELTDESFSIANGKIRISFSNGGGSNPPKYYTSGSAVRFYTNNVLTIDGGDYTITKVAFATLKNYKASSMSVNTGKFNASDDSLWEGSTNLVSFIGSEQVRFSSLTISYEVPAVTTIPVLFDGNKLDGNTYTSEDGSVTAVITVDEKGFVKGGKFTITVNVPDGHIARATLNGDSIVLDENGQYSAVIGTETQLDFSVKAIPHTDCTTFDDFSAKEATCTENGNIAYKQCTVCGKKYTTENGVDTLVEDESTLVIKATGHDYLYTANNDGTHNVTCTKCDHVVENEDCTYDEDSTTCIKCNAEKPAVVLYELVTDVSQLRSGDKLLIASNAKSFVMGSTLSDTKGRMNQVAAVVSSDKSTIEYSNTMVSAVYILGGAVGVWTFTSVDGKLLGAQSSTVLEWDGNNSVWTIEIADGAATISSNSGRILHNVNSKWFTNYASSTKVSTSMLLPQLYKLAVNCEHNNLTELEYKEATCTEAGQQHCWQCNDCSKYLDYETKEVISSSIIPAKGHNFVDGACSNCQVERIVVDKAVVEEAYALESGKSLTGTQTLRGKIISIDEAYNSGYNNVTLTIVIGDLTDKPIQCYRLTGGSELCVGDTITVSGTIKNYNGTIEFDANCSYTEYVAHEHTTDTTKRVEKIEATCTTIGTDAHYECESCGKLFVLDSEGKLAETTLEDLTLEIDSEAHSWDDGIITAESTCVSKGVKTFTCKHNSEHTKTEEIAIDSNAHDLEHHEAKAATCTETGYDAYDTCKREGCTYTTRGKDIPALEHDFTGEETEVTPATCGTAGSKTVKCTRCDETETQPIAATGKHTWTEVVADKYKVEGTENTYYKSCSECHTASTETFTTTVSQGFEVTTVIKADSDVSVSEDRKTYYLVAGNTITVQYVITANSGINGLEATIKHDDRFRCTSVVAGDAFGKDNITITQTADFNGVVKIAVTAGNQATSQGVLVTVTYTLKNDVTDLADLTFGLDLKVVVGDSFMDSRLVKVVSDTEHTLALRESTSVSIGKNELTYNGQLVTVGTENTTIIVTSDNKGTLTYTWKKNSEDVTEVKDAGTYQLTVSITGDPAHADAYGTFTVTINPYEIVADNITIALADTNAKTLYTGSAEWGVNDLTVAYNGADLPDKFEGLYKLAFANNTILATENPLSKEMSVKLTITSGNYVLSAEKVVKLTITATLTGIKINGVPEAVTKDYDKVAIDLSAITCNPTSNDITLTITVNGSEVSGEALKTAILNAGEYNVVVTASGTGYTTATIERTYTINAKELTSIVFKYAQNVATWTNTTTNDDEIAVTYKVGETALTENKVVAVGVGVITIVVETSDSNYKGYTISTVAAVSVKFVDSKFNTTTDTQYTFVGQTTTAPEAPTHDGWEFKYWYLTDEKTKFDFDSKFEASITLTAKWEEIINKVVLTIKYYYNGSEVDSKTVKDIDGYTELSGITMPKGIEVEWLSLDGYYTDKEFGTKFAKMPNADLTVYAKYDFVAGNGDINGDKTVDNNDIMLYRMYIVGGYDIEVIEIGGEYEAALSYAKDTETKFFFKAVANINGDKTTEGEIQTDVYDIRDAAVLAMAMVNANGYGVSEDNTHITTPSDSTNASASTGTQAVQYALLPTGKYAA